MRRRATMPPKRARNCARAGRNCSEIEVASEVGLTELKRTLPGDSSRRSGSRTGQERTDRSQPSPGGFHREEIHQPRLAVPRSDSGRQHRPDEGRGQIRMAPRLQVFHLCDLVDSPGDHPRHRRPGPHHPHSRAHDRDDQQAGAHQPPAGAGTRPRAHLARKSPSAWTFPWPRCARF